MTATKAERHSAILELVNHGSAHTQHEIAAALARRGMRATQATISRDIQELGLVRSGSGYRSSSGLVRELVLSVEFIDPMAVIRPRRGRPTPSRARTEERHCPASPARGPGVTPSSP